MRTRDDIEAAKATYNAAITDADATSYPPGYISAITLTIDDKNVIVSPLTANIGGKTVTKTTDTNTADMNWRSDRIPSTTYYIYLGKYGVWYVDLTEPATLSGFYGQYHPTTGERYIGKFKLAADYSIYSVTVAGAVVGAGIEDGSVTTDKLLADSVTADKISVSQLSEITGDVGILLKGVLRSTTESTGSNPITKYDLDNGKEVFRDDNDNVIRRYDSAKARLSIGGPGVHSNLIAGFTFENSIPTLEDASLAPKRVFGETVLDYSGYGAHLRYSGPDIALNMLRFDASAEWAEFPIQKSEWKTSTPFSIAAKIHTLNVLNNSAMFWSLGTGDIKIYLYETSTGKMGFYITKDSSNRLVATGPDLATNTVYKVRVTYTGNRLATSLKLYVNDVEYTTTLTGTLTDEDVSPRMSWFGRPGEGSSTNAAYFRLEYFYLFDAKSTSVDTAMDQIEAGTFVNLPGLQLQRASIGMTDGLGRGIAISPGAGMLAVDSNGKPIHQIPSIAMSGEYNYTGHLVSRFSETKFATSSATDTSTSTNKTLMDTIVNQVLSAFSIPPEALGVSISLELWVDAVAAKLVDSMHVRGYVYFYTEYNGAGYATMPVKFDIYAQSQWYFSHKHKYPPARVPLIWYQGLPYISFKPVFVFSNMNSASGTIDAEVNYYFDGYWV